ncbi:hypothetical protein BJ508DRAFT_53659 [Ascobolus immersus RN42]|uniref:Uncharacterized protein n=1 Tax=Ascobolus immersus RN42 TaxID=1160509 RepID=A0A3N4HL31_ASCIM|nr:hypothetical protein BJ508DRAFT_53659 [Ascobolus immersus RN42]
MFIGWGDGMLGGCGWMVGLNRGLEGWSWGGCLGLLVSVFGLSFWIPWACETVHFGLIYLNCFMSC